MDLKYVIAVTILKYLVITVLERYWDSGLKFNFQKELFLKILILSTLVMCEYYNFGASKYKFYFQVSCCLLVVLVAGSQC